MGELAEAVGASQERLSARQRMEKDDMLRRHAKEVDEFVESDEFPARMLRAKQEQELVNLEDSHQALLHEDEARVTSDFDRSQKAELKQMQDRHQKEMVELEADFAAHGVGDDDGGSLDDMIEFKKRMQQEKQHLLNQLRVEKIEYEREQRRTMQEEMRKYEEELEREKEKEKQRTTETLAELERQKERMRQEIQQQQMQELEDFGEEMDAHQKEKLLQAHKVELERLTAALTDERLRQNSLLEDKLARRREERRKQKLREMERKLLEMRKGPKKLKNIVSQIPLQALRTAGERQLTSVEREDALLKNVTARWMTKAKQKTEEEIHVAHRTLDRKASAGRLLGPFVPPHAPPAEAAKGLDRKGSTSKLPPVAEEPLASTRSAVALDAALSARSAAGDVQGAGVALAGGGAVMGGVRGEELIAAMMASPMFSKLQSVETMLQTLLTQLAPLRKE
jgi:hypothetical protein